MEINGYEDYVIYPDGNVASKRFKNRYLKPYLRANYMTVRLCINGKKTNKSIHRLVAEHYITNYENKSFVDHIDRNKLNNDVSNLRWATSSENNLNVGLRKDNKLGIKNIIYRENKNRYVYAKIINKVKHEKSFTTLEEAIEYKNKFDL